MATFTIMRLTFLEAVRRRIVQAALALGLAFLVLFGLGFYFVITESDLPMAGTAAETLLRNQIYNFLNIMGVYAINFLTIAMGALLAADTLAGEIASGTVQALVSKPVRRSEIVLGKWLGFAGLLALYLLLMIAGLTGIVYALSRYVLPNVWTGMALVYLSSIIIMSLTLACSSRFSALATGGVVFGLWGLAFIGGFVEQIGALLSNEAVVNVGIISSLILPTEAIFRLAAYQMGSAAAKALGVSSGPMFVFSVPSSAMAVYGIFFLAAMVWLAVRQFSKRDL